MSDTGNQDLALEVRRLEAALSAATAEQAASAERVQLAAHRVKHLEAVLETVPVGVVLADANGRIIHGNSHVEEMVRHPVLHSSDVDSYREWIAYHADGRRVESAEYPLSRVIKDGEERSEIDVHYERGDGTRFWMRIIGEPVRGADGQLIGATVALIDIDRERQLQSAQEILIGELNHRVKNAFAVVKSIVSQSLRKLSVQRGLRETIDRRLDAYSRAHAKLIGTTWEHAPIGEVAADILQPIAGDRVRITGPVVEVPSRQALAFSMAFYELATNAVKYGALSTPEGWVELSWKLEREATRSEIEMQWTEHGGPTPVATDEQGFGSFIIGRALQMETGGSVHSAYPASGFEWSLRMPVETTGET